VTVVVRTRLSVTFARTGPVLFNQLRKVSVLTADGMVGLMDFLHLLVFWAEHKFTENGFVSMVK